MSANTAVLLMDFQDDIVQMIQEPQRGEVVRKAQAVLQRARAAGVPVLRVAVRFREGYPEVNPRNKTFGGLKSAGKLRDNAAGAQIHAPLQPAQASRS